MELLRLEGEVEGEHRLLAVEAVEVALHFRLLGAEEGPGALCLKEGAEEGYWKKAVVVAEEEPKGLCLMEVVVVAVVGVRSRREGEGEEEGEQKGLGLVMGVVVAAEVEERLTKAAVGEGA